jgi:hypothetical protein
VQFLDFLDSDGSIAFALLTKINPAELDQISRIHVRAENERALEGAGLVGLDSVIKLPVRLLVYREILLKGAVGREVKLGGAAEGLLLRIIYVADCACGIFTEENTKRVPQPTVDFTGSRRAFTNLERIEANHFMVPFGFLGFFGFIGIGGSSPLFVGRTLGTEVLPCGGCLTLIIRDSILKLGGLGR